MIREHYSQMVEDVARSYNCYPAMAKRLINGRHAWQRAIIMFGPIRCWWSKKRITWMLDGKPINEQRLGSFYANRNKVLPYERNVKCVSGVVENAN